MQVSTYTGTEFVWRIQFNKRQAKRVRARTGDRKYCAFSWPIDDDDDDDYDGSEIAIAKRLQWKIYVV